MAIANVNESLASLRLKEVFSRKGAKAQRRKDKGARVEPPDTDGLNFAPLREKFLSAFRTPFH